MLEHFSMQFNRKISIIMKLNSLCLGLSNFGAKIFMIIVFKKNRSPKNLYFFKFVLKGISKKVNK